MKTAREIAADILCEVDKGAMSNVEFNKALKSNPSLIPSDIDFIKLLVSGVLEYQLFIDEQIYKYSNKSPEKLKPIVRNTLRVGFYQLFFMTNIPASAVCNEAVKIINKRKMYGLKGFVNAILRAASNASKPDTLNHPELPDYIQNLIRKRVNENAEKVFEAFKKPARISCRYNLAKAGEDEISQLLMEDKITPTPSPLVDNGYILNGERIDVSNLKAFKDGLIQIQGISSICACETLSPAPGSKVLDMCAAPGGKTIALSDMVGDEGHVNSRDLTDVKAQMIRNNIERSNAQNVTVEVKDATVFYEDDEEKYDYILTDVPCSGLGTIGHKPEIRNRVNASQVKNLSEIQKQIVQNACRYLKKGGRLLYSTCTLTFEENEENAKYIESLGLKKISERILLPGIDETDDGFFISLFEK